MPGGITTNMAMKKEAKPKKGGKRVPQHNEPMAKMPKHDGIPKGFRAPMPKDKGPVAKGGLNIPGKRKAKAKKK